MACDCIAILDKRLADHNSRIQVTFVHNREAATLEVRPHIGTEKLDPRKRDKMGAIATYCPFCGTRYEARTEPEPTREEPSANVAQDADFTKEGFSA